MYGAFYQSMVPMMELEWSLSFRNVGWQWGLSFTKMIDVDLCRVFMNPCQIGVALAQIEVEVFEVHKNSLIEEQFKLSSKNFQL